LPLSSNIQAGFIVGLNSYAFMEQDACQSFGLKRKFFEKKELAPSKPHG